MRQLVFSFAMLIATSGSAFAQSILERVLGQIDGASSGVQTNGVYANIAESIGQPSLVMTTEVPVDPFTVVENNTITLDDGTYLVFFSNVFPPAIIGEYSTPPDPSGDVYVQHYTESGVPIGNPEVVNTTTFHTQYYPDVVEFADGSFAVVWSQSQFGAVFAIGYQMYNADGTKSGGEVLTSTGDSPDLSRTYALGLGNGLEVSFINKFNGLTEVRTILTVTTVGYTSTQVTTLDGIATVIDGSITNLITGVSAATAQAVSSAGSATVFSIPTVGLGNMTTTVLGAVNTGEIALGVNATVDQAGTTTTRAISAAMTQIGGSAETEALVLNVAHNASAVNGSIQNTMIAMNGSIGSASTTTLGAVNTGTIVSGVDAAVHGIVGMTVQDLSGL
jgi:hypothetical protein